MTQRLRVALIAHDQKKDDMVAFARAHEQALSRYDIVAQRERRVGSFRMPALR